MLLTRYEIKFQVDAGMIENVREELYNATSLDLTLHNEVLREVCVGRESSVVSLRDKTPVQMERITITEDDPLILWPGEFVLASTEQVFHLPDHISGDYRLKSSMARIGLENLHACWCDPGWHGSRLTLELVNCTRWHKIVLHPGVRIGQMIFFAHNNIKHQHSYAVTGRYNNDLRAEGAKK